MDATEEILRALVGFPTVSSESNLALIAWVEAYLTRFHVPHWRVNEGPGKASLLARIGPAAQGGVVLSGHTDVVPVEDQPWRVTEPFTLTRRDEKFYGRGTADMKGFLALALAHVPYFTQLPLKKPVWLAFSHDEEIGCLGAEPMAQALLAREVAPQLVVIGEPTDMQVVGAHKGIVSFETVITGKEGHSSGPEQGVSALYYAGELMHALNRIHDAARAAADAGNGFPTPYSTVNIGTVSGGVARNILAPQARLHWEIRPLPGVAVEELLAPYAETEARLNAHIRARFPECGITTRQLTCVAGLEMRDPAAPHYALAARLAGSNAAPLRVSYGTEGCAFGNYFPTVVCGPGSIDQAHQADEYVSGDQLARGRISCAASAIISPREGGGGKRAASACQARRAHYTYPYVHENHACDQGYGNAAIPRSSFRTGRRSLRLGLHHPA